MDDKDVARWLGLLRLGFGIGGLVAPSTTTRVWIGQQAKPYPTNMMLRGLAARDAAIGVGLLVALDSGTPVRGWLEAGALSDAGDAIGTLTSWRSLPGFRRLALLTMQAGFSLMGLMLADSLD